MTQSVAAAAAVKTNEEVVVARPDSRHLALSVRLGKMVRGQGGGRGEPRSGRVGRSGDRREPRTRGRGGGRSSISIRGSWRESRGWRMKGSGRVGRKQVSARVVGIQARSKTTRRGTFRGFDLLDMKDHTKVGSKVLVLHKAHLGCIELCPRQLEHGRLQESGVQLASKLERHPALGGFVVVKSKQNVSLDHQVQVHHHCPRLSRAMSSFVLRQSQNELIEMKMKT